MGVAGQINQQVSEHAINQPGLNGFVGIRDLLEREFQFIQRIRAAFVDSGSLTGGANKHAGEDV